MEYLWAPWRMAYLDGEAPAGCIFCEKPAENSDRENRILWRAKSCFVILNAFPYNPGHLMVVPFSHVPAVTSLSDVELADLMVTTKLSAAVLEASMAPNGLNIGINQGRPAGAGIDGHIHQHVVPRWAGDTNFMTTVGRTKVLPQLVEETYDRLLPRFRDLGP